MADDEANEDQWLYGDANQQQSKEEEDDEAVEESSKEEADKGDEAADENADPVKENGENAEAEVDSDEDSDDDDVHITIGDVNVTPGVFDGSMSVPLKRLPYQATKPDMQQASFPTGGVTATDIESIGVINGEPATEFNLDAIDEKPWRKPGADITDYFNYGFTEDTWRSYCERHRRLRTEAGASPIVAPKYNSGIKTLKPGGISVQLINDNSKYSGLNQGKRAGPPPMRRLTGTIDVIGGSISSRRSNDAPTSGQTGVSENTIEVMTGDNREYGRNKGYPDISMPPPPMNMPPPTSFEVPPPMTNNPPEMNSYPDQFNQPGFYGAPDTSFFPSYEPSRDSQWNSSQGWEPNDQNSPNVTIPTPVPAPVITAIPEAPSFPVGSPGEQDSESRHSNQRSQSREASADPRSRDRDDRHRSHRRRRSGSRSPDRHRDRHRRSRSRSPSRHHRTHKRSKRDRDD